MADLRCLVRRVLRSPRLWAGLLVAALAVPVSAQETGLTVPEVADRIVAAAEADDSEGLTAAVKLAATRLWYVVDERCGRGAFDSAERLAIELPEVTAGRVTAYVTARRESPTPAELRAAVTAASAAIAAREFDAAEGHLVDVEPVRADTVLGTLALSYRGGYRWSTGRVEEAIAWFVLAAESAERIGWVSQSVGDLERAATCAWHTGRVEQMRQHASRMVELATEAGLSTKASSGRSLLGIACFRLNRFDEAERIWSQCLEEARSSGNTRAVSSFETNLGNLYFKQARNAEALERYRASIDAARAIGDEPNVSLALSSCTNALLALHDLRGAGETIAEAVVVARRIEHPRYLSMALATQAEVHLRMARYQQAIAAFVEARDVAEAAGLHGQRVRVLQRLGATCESIGDVVRAEAALREALDLIPPENVVRRAELLSVLCRLLAKSDRAPEGIRFGQQALESLQTVEVGVVTLETRLSLSRAHFDGGDLDAAAAVLIEAVDGGSWEGYPDSRALALSALARLRVSQGAPDRALELCRLSMEVAPDQPVDALIVMSDAHAARGAWAEVGPVTTELFALLDRLPLRNARILGNALAAAAAWHLDDDATSVARTREIVEQLREYSAGQTEEAGGEVRAEWSRQLVPGIASALRSGDVESLWFFLESSQAGTLLEALGGRDRLRAVALPPELADRDALARDVERRALIRHRTLMRERGSLKEVRRARAELEEARSARRRVIQDLQQRVRGAAGLVYPVAVATEDVQAVLRPGEVYVHFGHFAHRYLPGDAFLAVLVTQSEVRAVSLGGYAECRAAAEALGELLASAGSDRETIERHAGTLRERMFDPLALGEDVTRVLITAREFSMTALALAVPDREVVYAPSGSTLVELAGSRDERGTGVVGLGDPVYDAAPRAQVVAANRAGRLLPLPGTRVEVEAIATVKLLGEDATEENLRAALAERERWRSIHLACHGLAPDGGGMLSALAITVGETDDGNLTAREILMLDAPADLVALSACETGRGKNYAGEGVVGLPRAFMVAGASRVLCSLWKVDDQATRELMVKFYEEWKTKPAATALRNAQAHVRAQEKWSHPYFWAAWQLWGLPD